VVRAKGERSLSLLAAPSGARDEAVIAINLDASTWGSPVAPCDRLEIDQTTIDTARLRRD
jgi:hypothetical protein